MNRTPLMDDLCGCLPLRPLTNRYRCDMPVRWSHLSTADCHLVRFSTTTTTTTSLLICLFRRVFCRRYLVYAYGHVHRRAIWLIPAWLVRSVRPAGMKRPLALFTAFLKVLSACSTVLVSPASARYSSQASA